MGYYFIFCLFSNLIFAQTPERVLRLSIEGYPSKDGFADVFVEPKECQLVKNHPKYIKDDSGRTVPLYLYAKNSDKINPIFAKTLDFYALPVDEKPNSFLSLFTRGSWKLALGIQINVKKTPSECRTVALICSRVIKIRGHLKCQSEWKEIYQMTAIPNALKYLQNLHIKDEKKKDDLDGVKALFQDLDGKEEPIGAKYWQNFSK